MTNKLLEGTLCDNLTLVICVSYCSAANTGLLLDLGEVFRRL